jgi:biofilm PGA synthesis N-glycosyltransferase PgaC
MPIACSVGVMAHNEGVNIGRLLQALMSQRLSGVIISEILVVASGCTDDTEVVVQRWAETDPRVRLIVQRDRQGKASAVNAFLAQAREKILVLTSADLVPEPDAIEKLVVPFNNANVGMTAARPVPVNDPATFMGFAAHMLWGLHHRINLNGFKAGETLAFRKIFERIPFCTAVDEASVEPVIRGQGYDVRYAPEAIVHNKGPEAVREFLCQRRRIYAGHLLLRDAVGYRVSTLKGRNILALVLKDLPWRPRQFMWTWAVAALECYGRLLGVLDYKRRRDHAVWEIARSTKEMESAEQCARVAATVPRSRSTAGFGEL